MDPPFDPNCVRASAIESKSNTFVANPRQRRQSFGFASMRNRSKDDYCDAVVDRRSSAVPLQRCQSDFKVTMKPQRAINRNGTIARNQFRGIRRDVLESQTQRIIRSMTVSILYHDRIWFNRRFSFRRKRQFFIREKLYNGREFKWLILFSLSVTLLSALFVCVPYQR